MISQRVGIMNERFTSLARNSHKKSQKTIEIAEYNSFFCFLVIVKIVVGQRLTYGFVKSYKSIFHFIAVNVFD